MAWVMTIVPLVLLALGFPFFLCLLATALIVLKSFYDVPMVAIHQVMFGSIDQYALLAVPFFIFAGELMSRGGISSRILRFVASIVGGMRGSLPMTSLGLAAIFGAISGATTAAVAAVGSLTYPRMREAGYSERFAGALITAESAIDNLIPPSLGFVIYGVASGTSIPALFAAGILPGLVLAVFFGGYIYYYARRTGTRERQPFSVTELVGASRDGLWALGAIIIVLGGIYTGIATPTEAAGVACVYAMIVTVFVYRETTLAGVFELATRSMYLTSMVFLIVATAGLYSWLLTISGAPQASTEFIANLHAPTWVVLVIVNIFLLFVGAVLDIASAMLVFTPLLAPIGQTLGLDPVHFGVIVVMNLTIGTFVPPHGLNIFVCQAMFKVPSSELYPGLVPFIALAIAALMVVTYIPGLSLWIPHAIY